MVLELARFAESLVLALERIVLPERTVRVVGMVVKGVALGLLALCS